MTAEQFGQFTRERESFRDLPWLRGRNSAAGKSQQELRSLRDRLRTEPHASMIFVQSPDGLIAFSGRRIVLDVGRTETNLISQLRRAFRYYPEIGELYVTNYQRRPELVPLLKDTQALPFLHTVQFRDGSLSEEEVPTLARNPSVRRIEFVNCVMSPTSFAELRRLRTLEDIVVDGRSSITPDCFITLAQLPRFRHFYLNNPDAFNVPITDETRRAIESLDGRLEEFVADEIGTTVHASTVRALLSVKSLRNLSIDTPGPGLTIADYQLLDRLTNLRHLNLPAGGSYFPNSADQAKADTLVERARMRAEERTKEDRPRNEKRGN